MKKKCLCVMIAAALLTANANFVFAEQTPADGFGTDIVSQKTEDAADLFASVDGISFEYDYSQSTELVRVVKVKYDQSYFTKGISSFNVQISIPSSKTASVTYSTKLSGFDIDEDYSGGIYTCSGASQTNKIPTDGCLFTIKITLKENILEPFTISLTGDTSIGDTSITQKLSTGGLNEAEQEIPANINDVGDSGTDGAVTWEYANNVLKLHGNGTMKDYSQGGAPWYKYADKIKSIEFTADRLDNIGENAFYGLNNAETVILSSDIVTIGNNAFEGCTALKNIDIPTNSGVGIGEYAFKDCSSITNLYIPAGVTTIGRGAFEGCDSLSSVTLPFIGKMKGSSNSKETFSYIFNDLVPARLKTVSVTNETNVPEAAFKNCTFIENIYINSSVTSIGGSAFENCMNLKQFTLPSAVTIINDKTFAGCSSLTSINITDSITAIGESAFDGCKALASIYIPKVSAISDYTFRNCSSLTEIEIPTSVLNIGAGVLSGCTKLRDVKVPFVGANANPGSASATPEGIFGYFFGGTNSDVPAKVTKVEVTSTDRSGYIPPEAFKGCANIEDIIVYGGRVVCVNAFENCYALKNLYLPKSISTIGNADGNRIMSGCTRLETLVVPFVGTNRLDINTATSVIGSFFGYDDTNPAEGTMQYYNSNRDFHYYKIPKSLKNISVLNQTDIPTGAFMNCDFLENAAIVTGAKMNDYAFYNCPSIKTVSLPSDMTSIGIKAFAACESLETINIPTKVKSIGESAFYNCRALKNVTMPDSVTTIADDVFNGTEAVLSAEDGAELMASELTITCSEGSAAYQYAKANNIATNVVPSAELDVKNLNVTMSKLSTGGYMIDAVDSNNLTGTVYAAIYDAQGRLLSAKLAEKKTTDDVEKQFIFSEEETAGMSYAKVFLWGGTNKMVSQTTKAATVEPES